MSERSSHTRCSVAGRFPTWLVGNKSSSWITLTLSHFAHYWETNPSLNRVDFWVKRPTSTTAPTIDLRIEGPPGTMQTPNWNERKKGNEWGPSFQKTDRCGEHIVDFWVERPTMSSNNNRRLQWRSLGDQTERPSSATTYINKKLFFLVFRIKRPTISDNSTKMGNHTNLLEPRWPKYTRMWTDTILPKSRADNNHGAQPTTTNFHWTTKNERERVQPLFKISPLPPNVTEQ